ncbi:MAG: RluA family pseudouridine synthase, partial [Pyrinomonadaceae bacterium]
RTGDFVEIELDLSRETAMRPEMIPLEIIFEDPDLIVVNKPSGVLVHPTHREKNGTLLNGLSFHFNHNPMSKVIRPGLVHRLDKDTSGLMVVAKNLKSHRILGRQFQRKLVEKKYLALVEGIVESDEGIIEAPIGRFAEKKLWDVKEGAKPSMTNFRVAERRTDSTLLELEPVTGRTNQLRIHCGSIGHPIIGDAQRGGRKFERLCLHAFQLRFRHPTNQMMMEFSSKLPNEFSPTV